MHRRTVLALLISILILAGCVTSPATPQISVEEAWARPVPMTGGNGAIYAHLVNTGSESDRLIGGDSPLVEAVEVHQTTMVEGVMKMEPVPGLLVPAGEEVRLEPGGLHIMLIGVDKALAPGDRLPITLHFEKSGEKTLEIEVREFSGDMRHSQ